MLKPDTEIKDVILTKVDLTKILGITPPNETLTITDNETGVRIIIEPYLKGKGIGLKINKKITLKQLIKIVHPNRSILRIRKKYRRRYL